MPDATETIRELFGLTGKTALIIGGGQGMGEASAKRLAQVGCDVALVDLEEGGERVERVAADIRAMGRRAEVVIGDVLEFDQLERIVTDARAAMGRLDVLVNVVGLGVFKPTLKVTREDWDLDHNRNLRHVFFIAQYFARTLVADGHGGAMAFIASMAAVVAAGGNVSYGAAKAGVISVAKTISQEWAKYGIRANVVLPGSIITPRFPASPEEEKAIEGVVSLVRRGTPDDIARAVLFLVSDLSAYTTGSVVGVEGGWLAASSYRSPPRPGFDPD